MCIIVYLITSESGGHLHTGSKKISRSSAEEEAHEEERESGREHAHERASAKLVEGRVSPKKLTTSLST